MAFKKKELPTVAEPTFNMYEIRPMWSKRDFIMEQVNNPKDAKDYEWRSLATFIIVKFKEEGAINPSTGRQVANKNTYAVTLPEFGGPGTPGPSLDSLPFAKEHTLAECLTAIRRVAGCYEKGRTTKEGSMFELYKRSEAEMESIRKSLTPAAIKDAKRAAEGLRKAGIANAAPPVKGFGDVKIESSPEIDVDEEDVEIPEEELEEA